MAKIGERAQRVISNLASPTCRKGFDDHGKGQSNCSRLAVESIPEVTGTWYEWALGGEILKMLVVEVSFDTDPNSPECRRNVLEAMRGTVIGFLEKETTMIVSHLKIIPKREDSRSFVCAIRRVGLPATSGNKRWHSGLGELGEAARYG
jgi:hypothetical protein